MEQHRQEVRKRLFDLIFENHQMPYWITRGAVHRFGFDGSSGFRELARVYFNEKTNEFDSYFVEDDVEEYLGSSGDLSKARSLVKDSYELR